MTKILSLIVVFMLTGAFAFSQKQTVTGQVRNESGEGIPYVSVTETGSKNAVRADENGSFTIKANSGSSMTFSAANYLPVNTVVTEKAMLVTLKRNNAELTTVVVTGTLGINKSQKSIGSSNTLVQSKDLVIAKPLSVVNGLTGKVAGLNVSTVNNGVFAPSRVTLRASRSLKGNNEPLVVVDGAIFYNDIATINPEDIASINVLKGSSAAAVYGSDASNGILVITTKRGTRGKTSVTFTSTTQLEKLSYLMKLQDQFGSNGGEAVVNDINDLSTYIPYENQGYGPRYNGKMVPLGRPQQDGSLLMVPYSAIPNQKRSFFNTGVTLQNNLSISGGDESSRFLLSLQDVSTTAIMPGDKGHRNVFRASGSRTYNKLTANVTAAYTRLTKSTTNTGSVYQNVLQTQAHVPITRFKDWKNDKFSTPSGYFNDYADNPYWTIDNERNTSLENDLVGNLALSYKMTSWLNFTYRLAYTNSNIFSEFKKNPISYTAFSRTNNKIIYSKPDGNGLDTVTETPKYNATQAGVNGIAGSYAASTFDNSLITSDLIANIDQKLSNDFDLKLALGTSYVNNKIRGTALSAAALAIPVFNINNVSGSPNTGGGNYTREAAKQGYFADATIGFRNFAYVHGAFRTDKDSRLSDKNSYIPYYEVDGSLVVSDLIPALKDNKSKFLSFAKVRAAYSVTGNASALSNGSKYLAFGAYAVNPTYFAPGNFPYGNIAGYNVSTGLPNPDLKPETVNEKEVGLELGFFDNRFTLSAVKYRSFTKDGIVGASIPTSSGFTSALVNSANLQNDGLELEVKATVLKKKDLSVVLGANYSQNTSEVKSINGGLPEINIGGNNGNAFAIVGQPYPSIKSRDWVRDAEGRVIVDATSGLPSATASLVNLGNATAKDILGLTGNVTYKNVSLSFTMDYRGGYKIFYSIGQFLDFTGVSYTSASTNRQPFVFPNSVTIVGGKSVPNTNIVTNDANFDFWPGLYRSVGSNYVVSAAAWKLREVALVYQFPQSVLGTSKVFKDASVTFSGRNLLTFVPKSNIWSDPEFSDDGVGNSVGRSSENQAPPSRIFSISLALTF
jgi:TonB-linked SusC/RagA family outer membrane protein